MKIMQVSLFPVHKGWQDHLALLFPFSPSLSGCCGPRNISPISCTFHSGAQFIFSIVTVAPHYQSKLSEGRATTTHALPPFPLQTRPLPRLLGAQLLGLVQCGRQGLGCCWEEKKAGQYAHGWTATQGTDHAWSHHRVAGS